MTRVVPPQRRLLATLGEATPPPEPAIRPRKGEGRRVGATLPAELYVRFKGYVARHGVTGEQVIAEAIERLVGEE